MTPCSVFMTFENEEGVNRAINYNDTINQHERFEHLRYWLDKFQIKIEKAQEPSDIIWENRHFTETDRLKKRAIVGIAIALVLLFSFELMYFFSAYSVGLLAKYPPVMCSGLANSDSPDLLEQSAIFEYEVN